MKKIISLLVLIFFMLEIVSAINESTERAYFRVIDIYVFEEEGQFERVSSIFLAHSNETTKKDLIFSQIFPDYTQEKHQILSNITYNLYWNWILNQTKNKTIYDDYKIGDIVAEIFALEFGKRAHMERIYRAYANPSLVDLRLNLYLNETNPRCEKLYECAEYELIDFKRIMKVKKSIWIGTRELAINFKGDLPDFTYEEGNYRVYVWYSFPFSAGNVRIQDIIFDYRYKFPSWLIWTTIVGVLGIIIGSKINKYLIKAFKFYLILSGKKKIRGIGEKTIKKIKENL